MRLAVRIAGVIATPVHAMVLLGDVGKRQEVRKGAGNGQRRRNRHPSQEMIRTRRIRLRAAFGQRYGGQAYRAQFGSSSLCRFAHPLDVLEQFITLVMPQHAAEHFSKRAHVIAQRLMRIGLHRVMVQDYEGTQRSQSKTPDKITKRQI